MEAKNIEERLHEQVEGHETEVVDKAFAEIEEFFKTVNCNARVVRFRYGSAPSNSPELLMVLRELKRVVLELRTKKKLSLVKSEFAKRLVDDVLGGKERNEY